MIVDYEKDRFFIYCKFASNHLLEELDKRWNNKRRCWLVYDSGINRQIIRSKLASRAEVTPVAAKNLEEITPEYESIPMLQKTEPLPFQIPATKKLLSLPHCALFAPVGSGKTKIAIDVAHSLWYAGKVNKVLIIGLVSIIENWKMEIEKHWLGEIPWDKIAITGVESYSQGSLYSKILAWVDKQTVMIVDESSKIKNYKAIRTEKITNIGRAAGYRYAMTGSPLLNSELDLYAQFNFLNPEIIGISTHIGFKNRYCVSGGFQNKKVIGYKRQDELISNLAPYSFVIDKKEAMPHLPSQTFTPRKGSVTAEQKRLIERIKKEMISESKSKGDKVIQNILTKMLRISQIAGGFTEDGLPIDGPNPKLNMIHDILDDSPDEQVVYFVRFIPELKMLGEKLGDCQVIHGAVKPVERQQIVNSFQAGNFRNMVCQYQSGAMGLNMDAARLCVFYSFDFSLEMWIQSVGRIARTTQTRPMVYFPLLLEGSLDSFTYRVLQGKEEMEQAVKRALASGSVEDLF